MSKRLAGWDGNRVYLNGLNFLSIGGETLAESQILYQGPKAKQDATPAQHGDEVRD